MCKKSESIKEIAVALAKFNSNVQRIEKDATNPHFKNRYTTLDAIMDEVRPLLAEQGLSIIQMPSGDGEQLKLTTMLVHISGEWIESDSITMRPTKNDPQGIGSATTYARRYGLCAFLGLSTGDLDDDGNSVSVTTQKNAYKATETKQEQTYSKPVDTPVQSTTNTGDVLISAAQKGMIRALIKEKAIPEDTFKTWVKSYGVDSSNDLKKSHASAIIKMCQEYVAPIVDEIEAELPF